MDYRDRWHIIEDLGAGGQGKVYRVLDKDKLDIENEIPRAIEDSIIGFTGMQPVGKKKKHFESLRKAIVGLIRAEDPINHGALKVLHEAKDATDFELAEERIKREIEAMASISHPNLLKILDHDPDAKWFVSQFYPKGTLTKNKELFTGNFVKSLRAFRSLVDGVSELHKKGFVHRDIKPQNVFLDSNDNLVLGDFGLVFFTDPEHTRISKIWENVGSRDWMPAWAMGMIVEVKPKFDVFSLGKLLWAMISGIPILQLWYFEKPENNLENMFPNAPSISLANPLFKKCIVENEEDCLPDATALLEEVDKVLTIIDRNANLIDENIERPCKVCGIGNHELLIDRDLGRLRSFGINPAESRRFKVFVCNYCGHVQLFAFGGAIDPPAWSSSKP